ncbi:unnamed protein product [Dimorphilus gyrociliatus]|uniref:Uncharacterized protein n=1 Tax=Dimorphilus gyrociliatus TaxID=2664684 RepID=A0A7I8V819_9ANNE|nr:unnamed protein product [Dimorphilus gyrociliatus]
MTTTNATAASVWIGAAASGVYLVTGLVGAAENICLLCCQLVRPSLRSGQYVYVYSLAVANLILCLAETPLVIFTFFSSPLPQAFHSAKDAILYLPLTVIVLCSCSVAVNRLVGGVREYWLLVTACCVWVVSILVSLLVPINSRLSSRTLTALYALILLATLIGLIAVSLRDKKNLDKILEPPKKSSDHIEQEPDATTPSDISRPQLTETLLTRHLNRIQEKSKSNSDDEEEAEELDSFDLKMRMKQAQKSARRHTVANIGLGDDCLPVSGKLGRKLVANNNSKETPAAASSNFNYNYTRKWSVDITALQDQLENPKLYSQFRSLSQLKDSDSKRSIPTIVVDDTSPPSSVKRKGNGGSTPKGTPNAIKKTNTMKTPVVKALEPIEKENSLGSVKEALEEEPEEEEEEAEEEEEEDDDNEEDGEEEAAKEQLITEDVYTGPNATRVRDQKDNISALSAMEEQLDEKMKLEKLRAASKSLTNLYLSTGLVCCILVAVLFQSVTDSLEKSLLKNYLTVIAFQLLLTNTLTHPIILAAMDKKVRNALIRLKNHLTHWKFVCYCGFGAAAAAKRARPKKQAPQHV